MSLALTILAVTILALTMECTGTADDTGLHYSLEMLQRKLQYLYKTYMKYSDEMDLIYCWANYLFEENVEELPPKTRTKNCCGLIPDELCRKIIAKYFAALEKEASRRSAARSSRKVPRERSNQATVEEKGGGTGETGLPGRRSLSELIKNHPQFREREVNHGGIFNNILQMLKKLAHTASRTMDIVESNAALACTKKYLWMKIKKWLE